MQRLLILANHYNTLRIFRRELLMALTQAGHEVYVVMPECDDENRRIIESYGCDVRFVAMERRGMNPLKDMALLWNYWKLLGRIRPDKVIAYTVKCNIYGALACKLRRIPCYVNITGLGSAFQGNGAMRKLVSLMYRISLNKAARIFFENEGNRKTLVDDGIVRQEQTVVMAGAGVNLQEFGFIPYPEEQDGLNFLFVGRIMREKGVDELFSAVKKICREFSDTHFWFIGWYEDNYKQTVEQLQAEGYIQFYGFQPDVRPFLEKAHCVILPSWHEGMSNTLLEAAATGRALITSDIHGCKEAVEDGVNGYLCRCKDAQSLYEQIRRFALLSRQERERMGLAGRLKMQQEFDKKMVVEKTIELLGL